MARESWSKPASQMARELAIAGVSRERIRAAVVEWIGEEDWRMNAVAHAWADKVAADAYTADNRMKATKFHPRSSTAEGRTPSPADMLRPSDLVSDWTGYLSRTSLVAERRESIVEAVASLQQGLGLWPEMDQVGGAAAILARSGWSAERINRVLGVDDAEEAA